jgi:hypothetical protein
MSIEDRLGNKPVAWIAENAGDRVIGKVVSVTTLTGDYGPYPAIEFEEKGTGKLLVFHAFDTVAKNEVEKQNPQRGDDFGAELISPKKLKKNAAEGSKKTDDYYKDWHVVVEKPARPVEQPEWDQLKGSGEKPVFYDDDPNATVGVPPAEYEPFPDDELGEAPVQDSDEPF